MATVQERFEEKYIPEPNSGCWLWTASVDGKGYGHMRANGKTVGAHRIAHELYKGPIPDGLEIDHLCRVPSCVNPDHLEAVTRSVNAKRGTQGEHTAAKMLAKTHCPRGHPYSGNNLKIGSKGERRCRICENARVRRWKSENPDYQRKWRKANPDKCREYDARKYQKRKQSLGLI